MTAPRFDASKPFTIEEEKKKPKTKRRAAPKFDPKQDFEVEDDTGIIGSVFEVLDRPSKGLRAGISAVQEDQGLLDAASAFIDQLGGDAPEPPEFEQLAERAGFSTEPMLEAEEMSKYSIPGMLARTTKEMRAKGLETGLIGDISDIFTASPAEVVGTTADIFADPLQVLPVVGKAGKMFQATKTGQKAAKLAKNFRKGIKIKADNKAEEKILKLIARDASPSQIKAAYGNDRHKASKLIAKSAIEMDLVKDGGNPVKMLDRIQGKNYVVSREAKRLQEMGEEVNDDLINGLYDIIEVDKNHGLIGQASDSIDRVIFDLDPLVEPFDINKIASDLEADFLRKASEGGELIDSNRIQSFRKNVNLALQARDDAFSSQRSLSELQRLKKKIGSNIKSPVFSAPADARVAKDLQDLKAINLKLRDEILRATNGIPVNVEGTVLDAADFINSQNQRLQGLMNIAGMLENAPIRALKKDDVLELVAKGVVGGASALAGAGSMYALGQSSMAPVVGVATAAMAAARGGSKAVDKFFPPIAAKGAVMMSRATDLIPRSVPGFIDHADVLIARLAIMGREEMAEEVQRTVDRSRTPQGKAAAEGRIARLVPMLVELVPDMFEQSESGFSSEFDGKLHNPMEQETYKMEIGKRDDLSSTEKARRVHLMNKENKITKDEEFQVDPELENIVKNLVQ